MAYGTMAMLFKKLTLFLDETRGFRYIRGNHQMEIWLADTEELPVVVSYLGGYRYIISSGNLMYEVADEEQAYQYILRAFIDMDRIR